MRHKDAFLAKKKNKKKIAVPSAGMVCGELGGDGEIRADDCA